MDRGFITKTRLLSGVIAIQFPLLENRTSVAGSSMNATLRRVSGDGIGEGNVDLGVSVSAWGDLSIAVACSWGEIIVLVDSPGTERAADLHPKEIRRQRKRIDENRKRLTLDDDALAT